MTSRDVLHELKFSHSVMSTEAVGKDTIVLISVGICIHWQLVDYIYCCDVIFIHVSWFFVERNKRRVWQSSGKKKRNSGWHQSRKETQRWSWKSFKVNMMTSICLHDFVSRWWFAWIETVCNSYWILSVLRTTWNFVKQSQQRFATSNHEWSS